MTAFDDRFAEACAPRLLDEHGEWINYLPCSGQPRRIRALVDRFDRHGPVEAPDLTSDHAMIEVLDDPVLGIDADMLETGGDRVQLELRKGQGLVTLPIVARTAGNDKGRALPIRDHGLLQLRCGS